MSPTLADLCLIAVLLISAVTDLRRGRILNAVTYPAIALGLAHALATGTPDIRSAAVGLLVGGVPLYLMFTLGWMGGGDVKLMAAVGAWTGMPFVLTAMFYSIFVGGTCAALILIWQGQVRAVASDVAWLMTPGVSQRHMIPARGGAFPFGVAICAGTLIARAFA
jgi:prepilin peptidase CpaA